MAAAALVCGAVSCGGGHGPQVVVIGLDGADWHLITPWIESGELPNLKAFLEQSAVGDLTTVYPILSPVCWTSAVTGVNPGKHGIFDFQKEDPAGGEPLIETAANRRAQPIWVLLSDAGYRVGVMNVPMTYPPDPVRGKMISGFPFPSGDVNFTYPPELQEHLDNFPLDFLGLTLRNRTPDQMYADFLKGQEARRKVALDWLRKGHDDFLWLVFTGTDKVQHFFWKDMDPNHPSHDPASAALYGDNILNLWKRQDAILGEMLAAIPPSATVLLLSDHGFDAIYRQVNMANWLAKTDLGTWLQNHAIPPMLVTNGLMHYILKGQLNGSSDREAFLDKLIAMCRDLRDPVTGTPPFESLFRREDIYSGRMVEKAPDLVFQESPKYYVTRGVPDSTDLPVFQDVWTTSFSAHHRPQGILAIRSPALRPPEGGDLAQRLAAGGDFHDAQILDVTPTLLALMGEVIPKEMDGRVLDEVIRPDFLAKHPPRIEDVEGFLLDRLPPSTLTPEERERMKALPYIN